MTAIPSEPRNDTGRLRLAYVVSQYPAVNHTFIMREIRGLRAIGLEIDVMAIRRDTRPEEAMTSEEREESRTTDYVKGFGAVAALRDHVTMLLTRPLRYVRGLWTAIRLGRGDPARTLFRLVYFAEAVVVGRWLEGKQVAHFHTHFSSTVGLLVTRMFPVSMSVTIHGPDELVDPDGFHLAEKVAEARFVVAISNYARSQLMRVAAESHWDRIVVVPLGIDPAEFERRPRKRNDAWIEVISVGRVAPVKAHTLLVDAIDDLARKGRKVRLRIVGAGPGSALLKRRVEERQLGERVILEGALNNRSVRELYRQADVFALSSLAEGVPVVLMEAMAMELACVATRIMGVPELIRDGMDGVLVDPGDVRALSEAIDMLVGDENLRRRLGEAGRKRVIEKYDLARNVHWLAKVFEHNLHRA